MLTTVVSALKVIRIEAYTKVWEEDLINCCLQGRFCSHCSHHKLFLYCMSVYIWFIWREKTKRNKPPNNKSTTELTRTFVHKDFSIFQLAVLPGIISCCLALVHQEEQGASTQTESRLHHIQATVSLWSSFSCSVSHFTKHCPSATELLSLPFSYWRNIFLSVYTTIFKYCGEYYGQ